MRTSSLWLALVLAGCGAAEPPRLALVDRAPRAAQALYGGAVLVRAPQGYCVDPSGTRPRQGVAVLAACARLGGAGGGAAADGAVIDGAVIVEVGPAGSAAVTGNEAALAQMLGGAEGLSQIGARGGVVTVHETAPGLVIVRLVAADGSEAWRAHVDVAGRLATVSVAGRDGASLGPEAGLRLLEAAVIALQAGNAPAVTGL